MRKIFIRSQLFVQKASYFPIKAILSYFYKLLFESATKISNMATETGQGRQIGIILRYKKWLNQEKKNDFEKLKKITQCVGKDIEQNVQFFDGQDKRNTNKHERLANVYTSDREQIGKSG